MELVSYFATATVLVAVYMISKPRIEGQYLMVIADLMWLFYGIVTKQYALCIQSSVLLMINVSAIRNWTNKGVGVSHNR